MSAAFLKDLAERTVATYLQVFLGLLITSGITDLTAAKSAAIAAVPAALAVVKGALAKLYGDPESAGLK